MMRGLEGDGGRVRVSDVLVGRYVMIGWEKEEHHYLFTLRHLMVIW